MNRPTKLRVYMFHGGHETWDKSFLTLHRGLGSEVTIPYQYFLVVHPKGRLMFDTGPHPDCVASPDTYPPVRLGNAKVTEADLAPSRLSAIGLGPKDIDLVANSHLHYDHTGGNVFFKGATFLEQFDELQGAMWPEPWERRNYYRPNFDLPVRFEELDDDHDVFGDGLVMLVRTPGHTRGSQSLVVKLEDSGTFILAQDAVYLAENLNELVLSASFWDPRMMVASFRRLRNLRRRESATLVPGHDMEVWRALRHSPEWYE
jgi:glyoxylase-like metal-dependent hydrolase (beta-lactamase superfamily II)